MVKFFGLLFAVAGMAMQANAALLVKYDFTGTTAADRAKATTVGNRVVASDFSGSGNTSTSGFWTGSTNLGQNDVAQGGFTLSTPDHGFEITKVIFQFRASGTTSANRTQTVTLKLSSGDQITESQSVTSSSNPLKLLDPSKQNFDPIVIYRPISDLGPLGFSFDSKFGQTASNNAKFQLDFVEVYGSVVPEPASMAVFGMLAVPVAIRRLRRKN